MRTKRIMAWALSIAMSITILSNSLVFAAVGDIVVTTASMSRDNHAVEDGTDILLDYNEAMPDFPGSVNPSDTMYLRRTQDFMIRAESIGGQFYGTDGKPLDNALEFAYLDANKNPLKLEYWKKSDPVGFKFSAATSEEWINIMDADLQHTIYNLEEFWTLDDDPAIDRSKITISRIATTDHMITAHIFNAISDQFRGYIRVKATDTTGDTLIKDYPIIADGQYPGTKINSTTNRHNNGEYNDPANLPEVENTFIASKDFEKIESYKDYFDTDGNRTSPYISLRHPEVKKDELKNALQNADETVWTMNDITINSIEISDEEITSGINSVEYYIDNIQNKGDIAVETRKTDGALISGASNTHSIKDITSDLTYNATAGTWTYNTPIVVSAEGMSVLTVVAKDNAGLVKTDRYYFFIDKVQPEAKFKFVELDKNSLSLFSAASIVTNRQQALDMNASADVSVVPVTLISELRAKDSDGNPVVVPDDAKYQYRLLATKTGASEGIVEYGLVPDDYTSVVVDKNGNDLSGWKIWAGDTETPAIEKEFDGIVQVRVQDRAGNWSNIVSLTTDGKETIITDNTNPVIEVKEYALNSNADATGNTADEIKVGTATDILDTSARNTVKEDGTIENEKIHTITGDVAPWINDTAVLAVNITDADLANAIRSAGLDAGVINVKAEFHKDNENKEIKIWNKNGVDYQAVNDSFDLTADYIFGADTDKDSTFYIEYEGTGVVDITISVKDQADKNDGDVFSTIYKVQLRVDKINPYITYKGYDITDDVKADLLKPNTANTDYELRDMPWGPNSQVLEVVVKDDDITPVQSKTKNIKFNTDKPLDLYKVVDDEFKKVKSYAVGTDNIIALSDCEELANTDYESNVGYKFYLVYDGTGIAKIEFYADDSAIEPNVRDYPSLQATPVEYDAMLRVDKINPEIKNANLVQTDDDVNDGFMLFTVNQTSNNVNTRKQMKIAFEISDETTTTEQSGVNIQNEKIAGVDLIDVKDKYVDKDKTHLYNNKPTAYATDDTNDETIDPNIDYILLPVEVGEVDGLGGVFTDPASSSNADIEALVNTYIDKYAEATNPVVWQKASWKDGSIVVPDEFQGAIVFRTIDRVGNIDYSEPITFVAESRAPLIDFNPQNGYIWSQNNYGWSKRTYDYVEIRVKDDNEEKADAWLENVFISVTDLNGNDISTSDAVKFAHEIHKNDASAEVDPSGYTYVSLSDFTNVAAYGYDVIDNDGIVEKFARDKEGYIHLGFVRVAESAQIKVTIFDKAKHNDTEYTGNKTTGIWTSRIDRTAPVVTEFDLVPIYNGKNAEDNNNGFALKITAEDALSGMAPAITEADYNVYTPENIPSAGVFATDKSYLYKTIDDNDLLNNFTWESGTFNTKQFELPGLQYALIPKNGDLEDVAPWNFESNPSTTYDVNGYNEEMGKSYVWHNYVDDKTPVIPEDFDGMVVVRAIDKAGNITVVGYSSILDVEADDDWNNGTQYIQVRTNEKWDDGLITNVQYYGNNNLLFPKDMRKDLFNSLINGEGAIIEIAEEGITNVVITATEDFTAEKTAKAKNDKRNSDWEGNMIIGNATTGGYTDWKFQIVDVKIDKTNPEFNLVLNDGKKDLADNEETANDITISALNVLDPIPNMPVPEKPDELGYRSHIPSGIKSVEWCAVAQGSENEQWEDMTLSGGDYTAIIFNSPAFTGTIKVRVTDNAGNVTVKTQKVRIDSTDALISISKSITTEKCSNKPVDVFVTISKASDEYSDIKNVFYKIDDGAEVELPLTGGIVTVEKEGETTITVIAKTVGGKSVEKSTKVLIHYDGLKMPVIKNVQPNCWITKTDKVTVDYSGTEQVYYSLNGSVWTELVADNKITLTKGANNIKLQAKSKECLCVSDINEYNINYDNGEPDITIDRLEKSDDSGNISIKSTKDSVVIGVGANKGTCASEIKSLTYVINGEVKNLNLNGGNIVLSQEGIWSISDIKVAMESGIEKTLSDASGNKITIGAVIDKTPPEITATISDVGKKDTDLALLSISSQYKQKLDVLAIDTGSGIVELEYAVVEKGVSEPEWKPIPSPNSAAVHNVGTIIDKAFDGTVLVRAKDGAGNTAVVSQTVFTEGVKPEISLTAPAYGWTSTDAYITVDILDKGLSSQIKSVEYTLTNKNDPSKTKTGNIANATDNWAKLNSNGGTIVVTDEGDYTLYVKATDTAGNYGEQSVDIKIDKTAPTYSGSVKMSLFNVHEIPETDWDIIHDGWTYNHDVSLNGVTDSLSGIKKVDVTFTGKDGTITKSDVQTNYMFSSSGKYNVVITDNAGNIRNISFAIDKSLKHTINVVEVDSVGKINVAVTDGSERLTFYQKDEDSTSFKKMFNGVTDQFWDGATGVRQIYAVDDSGNKTNTLYVLVAPSENYELTLMNLSNSPNRYLGIDLNGENVTVVKNKELFNSNLNKSINAISEINLNEDGIYTITIK